MSRLITTDMYHVFIYKTKELALKNWKATATTGFASVEYWKTQPTARDVVAFSKPGDIFLVLEEDKTHKTAEGPLARVLGDGVVGWIYTHRGLRFKEVVKK